MDKQFNIRKIATKKIFISDDYLPLSKSLMTLPIFTATNQTKAVQLNIKAKSFFSYENLEINTEPLTLSHDFNVFIYIIQKLTKNPSHKIILDIKEYQQQNNIARQNLQVYREKINSTLKKFQNLSISFEKKDRKYTCGFINYSKEVGNNQIEIEISPGLLFLYEADKELIFNLRLDKYKKIKSLYAKALYLFYLSNNKNTLNVFNRDYIAYRLQCGHLENKVFNKNIRAAHKELLKLDLIEKVEEIKFGPKVLKYKVIVLDKRPLNVEPTAAETTEEKAAITEEDLTINNDICDDDLPF